MNKNFLQKCWTFVSLMQVPLIVVHQFDEFAVYTATDFRAKGRDYFMNEIFEGREVTTLVENLTINQVIPGNRLSIEGQMNNLPKLNFKFGHDNYLFLTNIEENKY